MACCFLREVQSWERTGGGELWARFQVRSAKAEVAKAGVAKAGVVKLGGDDVTPEYTEKGAAGR